MPARLKTPWETCFDDTRNSSSFDKGLRDHFRGNREFHSDRKWSGGPFFTMVDIGKLNNHRTHRGPVGLPLSPRLNGSPALRFASDASCLFHGALVPPTYATTRRPASPRAVDLVDLRRVRPSRSGRTRTAYHPVGSRRFERRAAPIGTLHGLRP